MPLNLNNSHTVFVLGAGFSVEKGIPTIAEFMVRMRDAHEWLETNGRNAEASAIEKVLQFRLDAAGASDRVSLDLENIEELFSLAAAKDSALERDIRLAISATVDFCAVTTPEPKGFLAQVDDVSPPQFASDFPWTSRPSGVESRQLYESKLTAYQGFAAVMVGAFSSALPKTTFISFNYDLLLEEALSSLHIPFGYGFLPKAVAYASGLRQGAGNDQNSAIKLLKLHGSINWALPGRRGRKLTIFPEYADLRQDNLIPTLIPPTWRKDLSGNGAALWKEAVNALTTATRIVIIGFSMPDTDLHFKYLLAAGLQRNLSLRQIVFVNPIAGDLKPKLERLLSRNAASDKRLLPLALTARLFLATDVGPAKRADHAYFATIGRVPVHRSLAIFLQP